MPTNMIVECKVHSGRNTLKIQVYRSGNAFACDRSHIERDGTESTQSFIFKSVSTLEAFIKNDSFYQSYPKDLDTITLVMGKYFNGKS